MAEPFWCEGKEAYESRAICNKVMRNMKRFGKTVTPYRCATCGLWHLGRPKNRMNGR